MNEFLSSEWFNLAKHLPGFAQNVAIHAVATLVLIAFYDRLLAMRPIVGQSLIGLLLGSAGALSMLQPIILEQGFQFDGRSVPLALACLFGGQIAATVAGIEIIVGRLVIGGSGALPAIPITVLVICACLWMRRWLDAERPLRSLLVLALVGVAAALIIAVAVCLAKPHSAAAVLNEILPTLLAAYPSGIAVLGFFVLGEQRRLSAMRRAADAEARARRLSEAKSEFLAGVSHDLRTPIAVILGHLQLTKSLETRGDRLHGLDPMIRSTRTLLMMVDSLLDLGRLEANRLDLRPKLCDLSEIVDDVVTLFEPPAVQKGVSLTAHFAPGCPRTILIDEGSLRRILFNLVGNAVKFTEHGSIGVMVDRDPDTAPPPKGADLRFRIIDTGCGIDSSALERIFLPYEQEQAGALSSRLGTGLGLAISRQLALALGGSLGVESRKGQGSTFTLRLRVAEPTVVANSVEDAQSADATSSLANASRLVGLSILVAEDSDSLRPLFHSVLTRMGAVVHCAVNGKEAIDVLQQRPIDVVLMDMQMPVMDGVEATRRIRASGQAYRSVPILALTADVISPHGRSGPGAPVDAVLTKPVDWDQLGDELAKLAAAAREPGIPQHATAHQAA